MDVRLRPSLVPPKRSQAQAVDVNERAAAHPKASIHPRRRPRRRPPVPILEPALTDRPLFTALNHRLL
jgi:hypothetical protein